jgi:hypothetical protein
VIRIFLGWDKHIIIARLIGDLIKKDITMKTKFLLACVMSLLSATNMYGYTGGTETTAYKTVILDFIDSHMNANFKKLDKVLDDKSAFKIPRGEQVLVQNKESLIDAMKHENGTQQNCSANYEVIAKSEALVIARVDFGYQDCMQHNYLILEKNADHDWKITQVCKIFDDAQAPDAKDIMAKAKTAGSGTGK